MGKNYFTQDQQEELKKNPYVKNVTEKAITYTKKFKEDFFAEYQNGKNPTMILREMGFDTATLGIERIKSIPKRIKAYSQRFEGFKDTRKGNCGRPRTKHLTVEEQLERVKHQNALLKQENEFLKKLEQLERKAQRTTRHQSKNSN